MVYVAPPEGVTDENVSEALRAIPLAEGSDVRLLKAQLVGFSPLTMTFQAQLVYESQAGGVRIGVFQTFSADFILGLLGLSSNDG